MVVGAVREPPLRLGGGLRHPILDHRTGLDA
jgi:hypothetical protein